MIQFKEKPASDSIEQVVEPQNIFQLRDYQKTIINETYYYFRSPFQKGRDGRYGGGKKSCLIYLPTAGGKTAIASRIIVDAVKRGKRVLFIVHRKPLVGQTVKTLKRDFDIDCGVIWGSDEASEYSQDESLPVQVAMLQSLQSRELPCDIGLVVLDECHTTGPGWQVTKKIFNYYSGGVLALSPTFFVGLTATPWRTKPTEGFCHLFDCLVRGPAPIELIKIGYLCQVRHFGFGGIADFSRLEVDSKTGDYSVASIRSVCNSDYNTTVVKYFIEYAPNRKTIFFCAFVEQVLDLTEQLINAGITAEMVIGDTRDGDRTEIFARFKNGETQTLVSCDALIEGYDETSIEAVVIARPTRSRSRLIQMCGRGARLHPGKKDCLFLDFGGNFTRIGRFTEKFPITLCPNLKRKLVTQKECPRCHSIVPILFLMCPLCGFEFPSINGSQAIIDEEEWDEPVFGELLSEEEETHLRYIRQQMKTKYRKQQNPGRVIKLFYDKFGYLAPDEWFVGAIFGMIDVEAHTKIYLNFLHRIRPDASFSWFKYMMELEFGKAGSKYRTRKGNSYTVPTFNMQPTSCWEALGIEEDASAETIKSAYQKLLGQHDTDIGGEEAEGMIRWFNYSFIQAQNKNKE
ncbi:DEAD/DEAH box helicase family protein [Gloeothece verrucosa]|uniref:Helicase domain protein n=1 Tax=Gloeothece verrucosa (strain PCC 7822) TaxID=497965 RepID=E0UNU0_GLOV7|nr:DEAD/DEAH box helicase family protein [Gloeothece verrucosa]ADN18620.1 helicase domain protein [Gloeothece verrucosa PCC 7822]